MPKPTLQNCFDSARALLDDDAVTGGEVFTNAKLAASFKRAYRVFYQAMSSVCAPKIIREAYHVVPAYTTLVDPSSIPVSDMAVPLFVEERGSLTEKAITGVAGTTTVTVTAVAHGFATNDMVTVGGVVGYDGTEGLWGITRTGADTFTLNGAIGTGSYSSGGTAVTSGEEWQWMDRHDRIEGAYSSPRAVFGVFAWEGDQFHLPPCTSRRQLRITYEASGNPPTSTSATIGVDDCEDLLASLTAAYAMQLRNPQTADMLLTQALGRAQSIEKPGGLLWAFLNRVVRAMQTIPPDERRRLPFRDSIPPHRLR